MKQQATLLLTGKLANSTNRKVNHKAIIRFVTNITQKLNTMIFRTNHYNYTASHKPQKYSRHIIPTF